MKNRTDLLLITDLIEHSAAVTVLLRHGESRMESNNNYKGVCLHLLNFGQLLVPQIIKDIFSRLMELDFLLMFLAEFLGVTGLPIVTDFDVVDFMGPQNGDYTMHFSAALILADNSLW